MCNLLKGRGQANKKLIGIVLAFKTVAVAFPGDEVAFNKSGTGNECLPREARQFVFKKREWQKKQNENYRLTMEKVDKSRK